MSRLPKNIDDDALEQLLGGRSLGVTRRENLRRAVFRKLPVSAADRTRSRWLFGVMAAALATASIALLFVAGTPRESQPQFARRGGAAQPTFDAFCLEGALRVSCRAETPLAFAVNFAEFSSLSVVVETPDGTTLWVFPRSAFDSSLTPTALNEGKLAKDVLMLDGPPGRYRIRGVFTRRALTKEEARRAFEQPESMGGVIQMIEVERS